MTAGAGAVVAVIAVIDDRSRSSRSPGPGHRSILPATRRQGKSSLRSGRTKESASCVLVQVLETWKVW